MSRLLFLVACAVVIGCGAGGNPFADVTPITREIASGGAHRRGPYLARSAPNEMTIVWRRIGRGSPVVGIGRTPDDLRPVEAEIAIRTVAPGPEGLFEGPEGVVQYEARITGLEPGTRYHYAILDGGRVFAGGPGCTFRTPPAPEERAPFRFWVLGDSGTGGPEQAAVHRAMRQWCEADGHLPDFALHVGDLAYPAGTDEQFQEKHFAPYDETLRNTVLWPTIGNHDGRQVGFRTYLDAFVLPTRGQCGGVPSGTEAYYSFDYGHAHFVVLDSTGSDRRPESTMIRWLHADLTATKAEWLIAIWHHAPHSKGSHDGDSGIMQRMRLEVLPILEDHGVDLVLSGHSHIYERSMLMDGAYVTPVTAEGVILDDGEWPYRKSAGRRPHQGTVYAVTGNGGGEMKRLGTSPVMKRVLKVHGSLVVDIAGDTLTARMIDHEGAVRDRFSIVKRGEVVAEPVLDPAQLSPWHYLEDEVTTVTLRLREGAIATSLAEFEIPVLPEGVAARVSLDTTGTDWVLEPEELIVRHGDIHATRPQLRPSCLGHRFPLPQPRLTWLLPDGEQEGRVSLIVPVWRRFPVRKLAVSPVLDGRPTTEEQEGLAAQSEFVRTDGRALAERPSTFWMGMAGEHLYLGFRGRNRAAREELVVRLRHRERALELRLLSDGTVKTPRKGVRTEVGEIKDGWTCEALIPLRLLSHPKPGSDLRVNLTRRSGPDGEESQWSYTNGRSVGEPEFLGYAVMPVD